MSERIVDTCCLINLFASGKQSTICPHGTAFRGQVVIRPRRFVDIARRRPGGNLAVWLEGWG